MPPFARAVSREALNKSSAGGCRGPYGSGMSSLPLITWRFTACGMYAVALSCWPTSIFVKSTGNLIGGDPSGKPSSGQWGHTYALDFVQSAVSILVVAVRLVAIGSRSHPHLVLAVFALVKGVGVTPFPVGVVVGSTLRRET